METEETRRVEIVPDTREFERAMRELTSQADRFAGTLTGAFSRAARGGQGLGDVLKGLARRLSDLALDAAMKPLETLVSKALGSALSGLGGAEAAGPRIVPFAKGGVIARPSFFPMGGAVGLAGEAGAEAIMPLSRGPDGRLGVAAGGRGAAPSIVFNVTTPDVDGFRRSRAEIETMIARSATRGRRGL